MSEGTAPDLSALLGGLLENPETLGRVMDTVGRLKESGMIDRLLPVLQSTPDVSREKAEPPQEPPKTTEPGSILPEKNAAERRRYADHKRFLEALRPYLGEERQKRVDQLLRLLGFLSAAEKMGGMVGIGTGIAREGRHDV